MRIFSFITSVIALLITGYGLINWFPDLDTFSGIIYFTLMVILLLICITGIIVNSSVISKSSRRVKT